MVKTHAITAKIPATLLIILVYGYIVLFLLNHENSWMMPELHEHKSHILKSAWNITGSDLKESLNWEVFEKFPRCTRPMSSFFEIMDTKWRSWLWRYTIPHPSLSLTFIFSLILSPVLLYKIFRNWGIGYNAALCILAIYLVSPGFLSTVVMLFRPAKPMTNFSLILCMFLASNMSKTQRRNARQDESMHRFLMLIIVMFVSFFWDETALLVYPALLVFFPEIILKRPRILFFLSLVPLAYVFYYHVIPALTVAAGFNMPDLSSYLPANRFFDLGLFYRNASILYNNIPINTKLLFTESLGLVDPGSIPSISGKVLSFLNWAAMILFFCGSFFVFFKNRYLRRFNLSGIRNFFLICSFLIFLCVFHSYLLHIKGDIQVWGPYWYGAYFSVIFTAFLAKHASMARTHFPQIPGYFLFGVALIAVVNLCYIFPYTNYAYKKFHHEIYAPELIEKVFRSDINRFAVKKDGPADLYRRTKEYWKTRRKGAEGRVPVLPKECHYLTIEIL